MKFVMEKKVWGKWLQDKEEKNEDKKKNIKKISMLVGILERVLYTTAIIMGQYSFIAIWLGIKVAPKWGKWHEEENRGIFNAFLIGNALSIIIAFVGAWVIKPSILKI